MLLLSFSTQKNTILTSFCNPEIPGLGCCRSQDTGLVKMARIPGFGIAIPTCDSRTECRLRDEADDDDDSGDFPSDVSRNSSETTQSKINNKCRSQLKFF